MEKIQEELLNNIKTIYSQKDFEIVLQGFNTIKRKTTFRINTLKSNKDEIEKECKNRGLKIKKIDFLENGYTLENGKEKDLWDLEIFNEGKIYIQQITSQLPVQFLDLQKGNNVLDITAAPGSKTSQIASILENTGKIIAIDNNSIRIDKLNFTLKRQGVTNTQVIKLDARKIGEYLEENSKQSSDNDITTQFDNILFDAPCSAEGKINLSKEKSYAFWNTGIVKKNYKTQKEILKEIIPLLKTGGSLVYSTCTINALENEAIIHFILCNFPEMKIENIDINYKYVRKGIKSFGKLIFKNEVENSIRILPSEETEGFFIAKFKKY